MDANFCQKNRFRSTTYEDVSLSDGWAYFVKSKEYMEYVTKFASQEEVGPRNPINLLRCAHCNSRSVLVPASKLST